jgi:tyrosine-specific transport protein
MSKKHFDREHVTVQAGTYGVLVLFGVLPSAMTWSEREWKTTLTQIRVVPGGPPVLLGVGGIATAIIAHELYDLVTHALQA